MGNPLHEADHSEGETSLFMTFTQKAILAGRLWHSYLSAVRSIRKRQADLIL